MGAIEKFMAGAVVLIGVYLIVLNPDGTAKALNGIAQLLSGTFGTLQGRSVTDPSGVTVAR